MKAAALLCMAVAVFWLVSGSLRLLRPAPSRRSRLLRRLQGVMLVVGALLLGGSAVALWVS
jgi:threonine/homoserine/homoserine lactone efflux protein